MAIHDKNVSAVGKTIELFPPLSAFTDVQGALEVYSKDKLAQLALATVKAAIETHRSELGSVIRSFVGGELASADEAPLVHDLKSLERHVRDSSGALEKFLLRFAKPAEVAAEKAKHRDVIDLAGGLVKLATRVKNDTVKTLAGAVSQDIKRYRTAEERIAAGGHPGLDPAISTLVTNLWADLDLAYDVLGICLRNSGISYEKIYANRPAGGGSLRRRLVTKDPGSHSKGPGRPKKPKPGKGTKDGGPNGTPNGSETPSKGAPSST